MTYDRRKTAGMADEDLKKAVDILTWLPRGVASWVEAHGGNRDLASKNAKKVKEITAVLEGILASMPKSVTYKVVGIPGSATNNVMKFKDVDTMIRHLQKFDIRQTGYNTNTRQRPELQGQPKFDKLMGPMYDGAGTVRYETSETYDMLSR